MLKRASPEDIVRVLEEVGRGETIVDPALTGQIARRAAQVRPGHIWPGSEMGLTQRESEVLVVVLTKYWYGVETADGHRGWVHRSQAEPLP